MAQTGDFVCLCCRLCPGHWGRRVCYLDKRLDASAGRGHQYFPLQDSVSPWDWLLKPVTVSGRRETDRKDLIKALRVDLGDPIFNIDVDAARERIESLGWVKTASISRKLPNTIRIDIVEREAVAIWQHDGAFTLIDPDGLPIGTKGLERYGHLKVLVGDGAPTHAVELLRILETEPELMTKVTGAVWVGSRRWNIRLDNGIDIRLPEDDPSNAWTRLAQLERDYSLLGRAIKAIDLRQSDRMIVRMTEEAAELRRARKDET